MAQSLVQGGMRVMVVNGLGMALAYLTHLLFAKWLGVGQYGYYVYVLAWLNVLTVLAQVGMNTSTVRITAELRGADDHPAILGLSMFSTLVVMATGVFIMALGGVALAVLAGELARELVMTFAVMLPLVVVLSLLYQRMAILHGFERVVQAQAFLELLRPVALIALVGVGTALFTLQAHWVMAANLAATTMALIAATVLVGKFLANATRPGQVRTFDEIGRASCRERV